MDGQINGRSFRQDFSIDKAGKFVQKLYDSKLYAHITSDKPILLVQIVLSQVREAADPAVNIIPPIEQLIHKHLLKRMAFLPLEW